MSSAYMNELDILPLDTHYIALGNTQYYTLTNLTSVTQSPYLQTKAVFRRDTTLPCLSVMSLFNFSWVLPQVIGRRYI